MSGNHPGQRTPPCTLKFYIQLLLTSLTSGLPRRRSFFAPPLFFLCPAAVPSLPRRRSFPLLPPLRLKPFSPPPPKSFDTLTNAGGLLNSRRSNVAVFTICTRWTQYNDPLTPRRSFSPASRTRKCSSRSLGPDPLCSVIFERWRPMWMIPGRRILRPVR